MCSETPNVLGSPAKRVRGASLKEPIAEGLDVVAHCDMDGRADGLQMQYVASGDRSYLYVGHFWSGGVSIIDVTDPAAPQTAGFIPTPNNDTWHIKVQAADGLLLVPSELNFFGVGVTGDDLRPGARIFDIENPTEPREIGFAEAGGIGVHRSWWHGGQYAYLAAGIEAPGVWMHGQPDMTRVLRTVDMSDPTNPRTVSDFWLDEQRGPGNPTPEGATTYVHQPTIAGDRAYVAYWDGGFAIVDISDRAKPSLISHVRTFPALSDGNTHTCLPLLDRNLMIVVEENTANFGGEGLKNIWVYDISDEERPEAVSVFPRPKPSAREPWESYFQRGDRFGPHCIHENREGTFQSSQKVYTTYCNAGLRVWDISDAAKPRESAFFVPPDPERIVDPRPYDREFDIFHGGSRAACSQDVVVDPRGYIYVSGTNDGIWILKESDAS